MAIEVQQIEGDEIGGVLAASEGVLQNLEAERTGVVQRNDLAVDNGAFDLEAALARSRYFADQSCPLRV